MKTVTVVLNGFKRQATLPEQIESLKNQSYPVDRIMYFNLISDNPEFTPDYKMLEREGVEYANTSHDYGVWGRFTFALNATTDFVCVMDDDIVPGRRYIENCVNSYEEKKGIYGTMGSTFNHKGEYFCNYGWKDVNNKKRKRVNYLYQTWFMPREALHAFWSESRPESLTKNRRCGEDMNISLMAKKKLGLNTYVVPHPADNRELWGNVAGDRYGTDNNAIHLDNEMQQAMSAYLKFAVNEGLELTDTTIRYKLFRFKMFVLDSLLAGGRRRTAVKI